MGRFARIAVVAALAAVTAAGCGNDSGPAEPAPAAAPETEESGTEQMPPGEDASPEGDPGDGQRSGAWTALLATIPDTPSTRAFVTISDHDAAQRARALDPDAVIVVGSERSGARNPADAPAWRAGLGFDVNDVDLDIEAGEPPQRFDALAGRFDADTIAAAVRSDPEWSPELETDEHLGIPYYRWGEDHQQDLSRRDAVRPLGRGGRLAVVDDTVLWTHWTEGIELMIATVQGEQPSLAEVEPVARIARALEEHGGFSAHLAADVSRFDIGHTAIADLARGDLPDDVLERLEGAPALVPYAVLGAGVGVDEDGWYQIIALAHTDEEQAEANAAQLDVVLAEGLSVANGRPWVEIVEAWTITTEGTVTVAVLRTDARNLWSQIVLSPDLVLWR
jgi:hypothetical protein